tara:strand:+ start:811 stop:1374 length:564 start_codon:yes stop_codon:yes gene_type:complete
MAKGDTLTPKQAKFVALVAGSPDIKGLSYTEAYRQSYASENMKPTTLRVEAAKLAKQPKIRDAIDSLKGRDVEVQSLVERVSRDWVVRKLQDEATSEHNPPATRVRALELLGKSQGVFTERERGSDARTTDDVASEIEAKLRKMFGTAYDKGGDTTPTPSKKKVDGRTGNTDATKTLLLTSGDSHEA